MNEIMFEVMDKNLCGSVMVSVHATPKARTTQRAGQAQVFIQFNWFCKLLEVAE